MKRRTALTTIGLGTVGLLTAGAGPPACGVSKEKAVKYTSFAIDYLKDILPIVGQMGGAEMSALINKTIPMLEKLKSALDNSEFPTAGSLFDRVKDALGQVANALLQLPPSPRRDQVMGILTLVNITLRTVSLFVETETPQADIASIPSSVRKAAAPDPIRKAFEVSRF